MNKKTWVAAAIGILLSTGTFANTAGTWSLDVFKMQTTIKNNTDFARYFMVYNYPSRRINDVVISNNPITLACEDFYNVTTRTIVAGAQGLCVLKGHGTATITLLPGTSYAWGAEGTYEFP